MRSRRTLYALLILFVAGLTGHLYNRFQGQSISGLVAKELRDQESASGTSLDIHYQYQMGVSERRSPSNVHYMRTPGHEYIRWSPSDRLVILASYDRDRKEFRQLSSTAMGNRSAIVSREPVMPFTGSGAVMDVYRFRLGDSLLADVIERGRFVSREKLEGHLCWKFESSIRRTKIPGQKGECIIWVDPQLRFAPRQIEIREKRLNARTFVFKQYREVGQGVWYPMVIADRFMLQSGKENPPGADRVTGLLCRATKIRVGQTLSPTDLQVVFPTGTQVRDDIQGRSYSVP